MYIPAARERVRIVNRSEVFFVLSVDREDECVYVVDIQGAGEVECIRLKEIEPLQRKLDTHGERA